MSLFVHPVHLGAPPQVSRGSATCSVGPRLVVGARGKSADLGEQVALLPWHRNPSHVMTGQGWLCHGRGRSFVLERF